MHRLSRRLINVALVLSIAAVLPWTIVAGVNETMGKPSAAFDLTECTRACHDHGCSHNPVLPDALTSDEGLFGETIRALKRSGRATGLGARKGYGLANLLLFCVVWPALMLGLLGAAVWQYDILRRRA